MELDPIAALPTEVVTGLVAAAALALALFVVGVLRKDS